MDGDNTGIDFRVDDAALPQSLIGSDVQVPSVSELRHLRRRIGVPSGEDAREQLARLDRVIAEKRGGVGSNVEFIQQNVSVSYASSARLRELLAASKSEAQYPGGVGQRLKMIAKLIKAELGTTVYYTRLAGFDTHANQRQPHANLLSQFSLALSSFYRDLTAAGLADRVLTFAFSEFGRRLRENGSKGTDHGTAGPVFMAGSIESINGGLFGNAPNLKKLVDGDPTYSTDFRTLYVELLEDWLNSKATGRIQSPNDRLGFLR